MAQRVWGGGTGPVDGLWSTATNWTDDQVPDSTDEALFNSTDTTNCRLDVSIAVATFTATSAYTGTIDGATDDLDHDVSGDVTLDCTRFDAGDGTWTVGGSFDNKDVTTWNRDASEVEMTGYSKSTITSSSSKSFYTLKVSGYVETTTDVTVRSLNVPVSGTLDTRGGDFRVQGGTYSNYGVIDTSLNTYFYIENGTTVTAQDGYFRTYRLEFAGNFTTNTIAPGTYIADNHVRFTHDADAAQTCRLSGGQYIFETSYVYVQTKYNNTYTFDNSVNNPDIVIRGGSFSIQQSTGTTTYTKGTGTITVDAPGNGNYYMYINGYSVEDLVWIGGTTGARIHFYHSGTLDSFTSLYRGVINIGNTITLTCSGDFTVRPGCGIYSSANLSGCTLNVGGDLDIRGGASYTSPWKAASTWYLNVTGSAYFEYCDIGYCDASGSTSPADASLSCTNSGNNTSVDFTAPVNYTWSAAGAGVWNNSANWTPTGVPSKNGDTATFDATSTQNCRMDVSVRIASLTATSGYTGTLDGATDDLDHLFARNVTLDCTQVDMGDGTWTVRGSWDHADVGTFNSNSGGLYLEGTNSVVDSGRTLTGSSGNLLNDVDVHEYAVYTVAGDAYGAGTVTVYGGISVNSSQLFGVDTGDLKLPETGTISGAGSTSVIDGSLSQMDNPGGITTADLQIGGSVTSVVPGIYGCEIKFINSGAGPYTTNPPSGVFRSTGLAFTYTGSGTMTVNLADNQMLVAGSVTCTNSGGGTLNLTGGGASYVNYTGTADVSAASSSTLTLTQSEFLEMYVSSSAAGGGSGLSTSPWTLDEALGYSEMRDRVNVLADGVYHVLNQITTNAGAREAPITMRGRSSSDGSAYGSRTNAGPLDTSNMPEIRVTRLSGYVLYPSSWWLFESLRFISATLYSYIVFAQGAAVFRNCAFENSASGGSGLFPNEFSLVLDCDAEAEHVALSGGTSNSYTLIIGCRVRCTGSSSDYGITSRGAYVFNTVVYDSADRGVQSDSPRDYPTALFNSTVVNAAGSAYEFGNNGPQVGESSIGNMITGCARAHDNLYVASGANPLLTAFNRVRDNTSADVGVADYSQEYAYIEADEDGDDQDYFDASAQDYRMVETSPGAGNGSFGWNDIGALQAVRQQ